MNGHRLTATTMGAGAAFGLACVAFAVMYLMGTHRTALAIPAAFGWAAALAALRPLVAQDMRKQLYFAFGVMAFLIFFLHETYEYTGKVRAFPLIIGYTGVVFSVLDILSLTDTTLGHAISRIFGCALEKETDVGKRTVRRELTVFAAMGTSVLAIWLVGFLVAAPLFVGLWMVIGGGKPVRHALYGGAATLGFIYLLFEVVLRYELYRGIIGMWLIDMLQA